METFVVRAASNAGRKEGMFITRVHLFTERNARLARHQTRPINQRTSAIIDADD